MTVVGVALVEPALELFLRHRPVRIGCYRVVVLGEGAVVIGAQASRLLVGRQLVGVGRADRGVDPLAGLARGAARHRLAEPLQVVDGGLVAGKGGRLIEFLGFPGVALHSPADFIHAREVVHGHGVVLLGRFFEPLGRSLVILLDALPGQVHEPEIVLGIGLPVAGCVLVPVGRDRGVLHHAMTVLIGVAEPVLGVRMAPLGGSLVELDRGGRLPFHALAAGMEDFRQPELRLQIAFAGRTNVPRDRLLHVLLDDRASFILVGDPKLGVQLTGTRAVELIAEILGAVLGLHK